MKTKIYIISLLGSLLLTAVSCLSDGKEEFLDEYDSFVYLLNSGEQEMIWYKTGAKINYNVTVNKAGNNLDQTASAEIKVMGQTAIDTYNQENLTSFKALPADCYELPQEMSVSFGEKDLYLLKTFVFDADKIYDLNTATPADYVLMLELANSTSTVTPGKKYQIIHPTVLMPSFSLEETGLLQPFTITANKKEYEYAVPIKLAAPLLEDITCKVEVDEQLLAGHTYKITPESNYSAANVAFRKGETTANLVVKIDINNLPDGEYALPLRVSNDKYAFDGESTLIIVFNTMPKIPLTLDMLTLRGTKIADDYTLERWIDNDLTTDAQTIYGDAALAYPFPHQLDVTLDESISYLKLKYRTKLNANQSPKAFNVQVSNDGTEWKKVGSFTQSDGLPATASTDYETSTIELNGTYKYVRFEVTNSYNPRSLPTWGFTEFELYGK